MNKRGIAAIAGGALLAAGGYALAGGTVVSLGSSGPSPETVTVGWAETVTFTNSDSQGQVVELPRDAVTSEVIPPGSTFDVVLTGRGGNHQFRVTGNSGGRPASGLIVVDAEGTVTLEASEESVATGRSVTLSGVSSFAGKPVTVQSRLLTDEEWSTLADLVAGENGSFSTTIRPEPGVRYRAVTGGGGVTSAAIGVGIEPKLRLRARPRSAPAGSSITLRARARPADSVRRIDVERFDSRRKRWVMVARKRLDEGVATFKFELPEGTTRLRAAVRRFTVTRGYDAATSPQIAVRGR